MHLLRAGLFATLVLLTSPVGASHAQDTTSATGPVQARPTVTFNGTLQAQFSYARDPDAGPGGEDQERLGFGLKRARLKATLSYRRAGLSLQVGESSDASGVKLLDFLAFYRLTPRLQVNVGRMVSAMPRGYVLTPFPEMDLVDRMIISEQWGRGTMNTDGRDFGADLRWTPPHAELILFVHNGDGSWSGTRGNFKESVGSTRLTGGVQRTGMAVSLFGSYRPPKLPAMEVGGFAGYNGSRNPNTRPYWATGDEQPGRPGYTRLTRAYGTWSAHAYWGAVPGSMPLRMKLDAVGLHYEKVGVSYNMSPYGEYRQNMLGLSGLLAARVAPNVELAGRIEQWKDLSDHGMQNPAISQQVKTLFFQAGPTFSLSARHSETWGRQRLSVMYGLQKQHDEPASHLAILQFQLAI